MICFVSSTEKPKIVSFRTFKTSQLVPLHGSVILKCEADGGILPTMLNITFNGGNPEILQNGIKIIENFTKDSIGVYKCVAFNTIGSSSLETKLNIGSNGEKAIVKLQYRREEGRKQATKEGRKEGIKEARKQGRKQRSKEGRNE